MCRMCEENGMAEFGLKRTERCVVGWKETFIRCKMWETVKEDLQRGMHTIFLNLASVASDTDIHTLAYKPGLTSLHGWYNGVILCDSKHARVIHCDSKHVTPPNYSTEQG